MEGKKTSSHLFVLDAKLLADNPLHALLKRLVLLDRFVSLVHLVLVGLRNVSDGCVVERSTSNLRAGNIASEEEVETAVANHAKRTARETDVSGSCKSRQNSESGHGGVERVVDRNKWIRESGVIEDETLPNCRVEILEVIQWTSGQKTQCYE